MGFSNHQRLRPARETLFNPPGPVRHLDRDMVLAAINDQIHGRDVVIQLFPDLSCSPKTVEPKILFAHTHFAWYSRAQSQKPTSKSRGIGEPRQQPSYT